MKKWKKSCIRTQKKFLEYKIRTADKAVLTDCRKSRSTASGNIKIKYCRDRRPRLSAYINDKKPQEKHRVFLEVACFLRNRSLQYHRTATKTISQNITSFFTICQRVDIFIDTLRGMFLRNIPLCSCTIFILMPLSLM